MKTLKKISRLQQQISLTIPLLCAIQSASALGLGEAAVNSNLNQPLSVSVPIFLSSGEKVNASEIIAGLANAAEHNRAGLPYGSILKDLSFNITRTSQGQMTLNINSQRSLYEPIINFLVDVNWDDGQLVKEISIFLDPVNFQPVKQAQPVKVVPAPQPIKVVTRQTLNTQTERRAAPPVVQRERPRPAKRKPIVVEDGNYTVQRGDSLSRIASTISKNSGFSMKEAMQVIFEMNPDAFMGSMDQLKAGADLSIPDMTVAEAPVAEPVEKTPAPEPAPAPAPTPVVETKPEAKPEPEPITAPEIVESAGSGPRLEIVPPEELTAATETTSVATETATTETPFPAVNIDGPEDSIPAAVTDSGEVMEMQSQLAEIQGENSKLELALNETRDELEATSSALSEMREDMKSLLDIQKNQVVTPTVTTKTWTDWIPWMIAGLLGLLAILGYRRNQPVPLAETIYTSSVSPRQVANMSEAEIDHPDTSLGMGLTEPAVQSLLDEEPDIGDATLLSEDDSTQVAPPASTTFMEEDPDTDETSNELDSVQEAEIYLAYHQYSLAEKTIDKLLDEDSNNHIFKLLKLRLLAETGKMNEMQSLSVELFNQFPDRQEETHQKIQSICDKAFTTTGEDAATSILSATGQTEIINSIDDSESTSETFIQEDMTDFLSDATQTDTQPQVEKDILISTELDADTIAVEDQDLTLPEYRQASEDINFIAEDLTEEGLDLPFDLETEILEEEARRMAADREARDKKDS